MILVMTARLSDLEAARWGAWKAATDGVWGVVVARISAATGLSGPDFSVLTRVVESPEGDLRQQRLSDDLGWERSRLSRQVARMEARGLLERTGTIAARRIIATEAGRSLVRQARIVHAEAVRDCLLDAVPDGDAAAFWEAIVTIGDRANAGRASGD